MPTLFVPPLEDDGPEGATPRARQHSDVLGEVRQAQRRAGPRGEDRRLGVREADAVRIGLCRLVVDAEAGVGAGVAEQVDADPGEDLVLGPRVRVGPVAQLLVDPREQAHGAVGHPESGGVRPRALDLQVPGPMRARAHRPLEPSLLRRRVAAREVLQQQQRRPQRRLRHDEVHVRREHVARVERPHQAGDVEAPVAALGDWLTAHAMLACFLLVVHEDARSCL